jgi:hypothetical protein
LKHEGLVAERRIAAKVRRIRHLDRPPLSLRKREKAPRQIQNSIGFLRHDVVPHEVERADRADRPAQLVEMRFLLAAIAGQEPEIDRRYGRHSELLIVLPQPQYDARGATRRKKTAGSGPFHESDGAPAINS